MYLQSLELLGFKSFAPKTTLNFHRGVTAIVGPNGCGKSNVLDAIRWVLGEQSAKALRGGEMADVIFSGTDSRPALGLAEVSMTFAECEQELGVPWHEVRITRRVHRDGHSEYLLNNAPCRLKDIHQLFMDTGIGRSAYSIMEQGKIDLILSSRPEDRRAIFEEAAGITKFKAQKKEALRKLEYTEANLLRVTDIIKEVKRQIGSLQRQAGKARRYQALVAALKTFETHLSHQQFARLNGQLENAAAEIQRLQKLQDEQQAGLDEQEGSLAARRQELERMEERLTEARQSVQELKNQMQNAEHRIGFNDERIREARSLIERYERDVASSEEKLAVQQNQIETTDLELEQIAGTLQFEQSRLDEKLAAAAGFSQRRNDAEAELQQVYDTISRTGARLDSLKSQISSIVAQREGQQTRLAILTDEIEQLTAAGEALAAQQTELRQKIGTQSSRFESQQRDVQDATAGLHASQNDLRAIEQELQQKARTLSERESRLEVLRQLNAEGEGFSRGTQAVLRGLDNPDFFKPCVAGALATHLDVEEEYIPAIEAALGHHLQTILFKDASVAEAAIHTLSGQKLGRAALAIRDLLPQGPADHPTVSPAGSLGWAIGKVRADGETAVLLSHLLQGIAIVDDLETALGLKPHHPGITFVTLAGELVSREGVLQGGRSGDAASSVLHRKTQITALESEVAAQREALDAVRERQIQLQESVAQCEERLQAAREESQRLNVEISTLRGQLALLERQAADAAAKQENLSREREAIEGRRQEAGDRLTALENEKEEAARELADNGSRQTAAQDALEALRGEEAAILQEANELKVKVATERQRHDSLKNQRLPMAARLGELRDLILQRRVETEEYQNRCSQLSGESDEIRAGIAETRQLAADAEQSVAALLSERAAIHTAIESMEADLRALRRQLSENQDQRSQHEVKQTQLQIRIENLCDHISRRYHVDLREFRPDTYALLCSLRDQEKRIAKTEAAAGPETPDETVPAAEPQPEEAIDWERIESYVKEIDEKIESMGPVNIDAIQEYDELEERHQFLENQFNDLTTSKAELLDAIAKINITTRKLFAETFEKVRANFAEMFTELFGGGKANLVLLDESDPLESGIDIIAKPPGKQLQSVSLLSGGERTMTAVAMLFAIYMVKPSPFCVLDEMDAPLDESNISRFIKLLDRFVTQSQFVVITHNKRTIGRADVLYGVTMEEHGVSKLVGVKFTKRDESTENRDLIGSRNPAPVPSVAETFGKSSDIEGQKAG